jgi:hypothetical protein
MIPTMPQYKVRLLAKPDLISAESLATSLTLTELVSILEANKLPGKNIMKPGGKNYLSF